MSDPDELVRAAREGKVGTINQLLDSGMDVNAVGRHGGALHAAIGSQRYFCVQTLIRRGADVHGLHNGHTPLQIAVDIAIDGTIQTGGGQEDEPLDIVHALLAAGADPRPALGIAQRYKSAKLVRVLDAAARAR